MGNLPPSWLLAGGRLAGPERVDEDGWLAVRGDRIVGVGRGTPPGHPDVELGGRLVVPGFVDLHCHGGGGANVAFPPGVRGTVNPLSMPGLLDAREALDFVAHGDK